LGTDIGSAEKTGNSARLIFRNRKNQGIARLAAVHKKQQKPF
jgi:hypothetical protein